MLTGRLAVVVELTPVLELVPPIRVTVGADVNPPEVMVPLVPFRILLLVVRVRVLT